MDNRTKILATSIVKLYWRGAERNIRRIINQTHDVDVAEVLETLDTAGRISVFQIINDSDRQAKILSHMTKNSQEEIAHVLETSKLQKLLSKMDSDDAADLLGHLPEEMSQKVLGGLKQDELQDVEELMAYPEDSAGGLMGSEFLTMNEKLTVNEAIALIQSQEDDDYVSFYVYVTNENLQLVGVLSLKQLILSKPSDVLQDIMMTDVISVEVGVEQTEVATLVERYDFLSLPVVDNSQKLVGIITVDDVIDVIREEAEDDFYAMGMTGASHEESIWTHIQARLPWLILAYIGGGICYVLLWNTLTPFSLEYMLKNSVSLMPIIFLSISTLSSQTVTMTVSLVRNTRLKGAAAWRAIRKEFAIGAILSVIFGLIFLGASYGIQHWFSLPSGFALLLGAQMMGAVLVSMGIPLFINRLSFNPLVSAPSISMILSNILAVGILVVYYALS